MSSLLRSLRSPLLRTYATGSNLKNFDIAYHKHSELEGLSEKSKDYIRRETTHGAHNYHPLPVVITKGEGCMVWDTDNRRYFDFLSAYSAVNQGHCHPRLVAAICVQAQKLHLFSRAFYSDLLGEWEQQVTTRLGYDRMLPMNSGGEAVETALKMCRKWGYEVKGVKDNTATILFADGNFHGRTLSIVSASTDPAAYENYGPKTPNMNVVEYNNLKALENAFEQNPSVVAYIMEPIQGERGVFVPDEGYLRGVRELCTKYKVLMVADEVQTGLCRTGRMLAVDHEGVKPDVLILGKALSGGMLPASAVLSSDEVMLTIQPGQHGSTFGGNPLAAKVCMEALDILVDERLDVRAQTMGRYLREELNGLAQINDHIELVRGKGLLNAVVIKPNAKGETAWDVCLKLRDLGMLAKPTHGNIIRLAPPLCISQSQLEQCVDIFDKAMQAYADV